MIDEPLTDEERTAVVALIATTIISRSLRNADDLLMSALAKITGTETEVIARRTYPSSSMKFVLEAAHKATAPNG